MAKKPPLTKAQESAICNAYQDGASIKEIMLAHSISHDWIFKLLRYHKIPVNRGNRGPGPRTKLLGVDVTPEVKRSLHEEARRRGMSKSSLGSKFIADALRRRGYNVEDEGAA